MFRLCNKSIFEYFFYNMNFVGYYNFLELEKNLREMGMKFVVYFNMYLFLYEEYYID